MTVSAADTSPGRVRQFPIGTLKDFSQLPVGRFRSDVERLPPTARARALRWLQSFHFTEGDLPSLRVDPEGAIFYICNLETPPQTAAATEPVTSAAAVPVSPFPSQLVFHSRPGAPNVLFINFSGEYVTGTAWNSSSSQASYAATAFSTDADFATFSDAEQAAIKQIWQRMAEDYAPFNIDVTTERPATFTTKTAMALITRNTDTNNVANPASTAGGVAYVNVFGQSNYATYRPAWIYYNNLANNASYIAEAASHEVGHNLGLSHDGQTGGLEYYGGHGSGDISWGPIMGTGYNRNVSQWSKGDYYLANNTEDDLAIISAKITYRPDDCGDTAGTATALTLTGGTNIVSTTPENDPANTNTVNKGVLEHNTDIDVYSFVTGSGPVSLAVNPWIAPSGTRGGNLDILLELYNDSGALLMTNNSPTTTAASIQTNLPQGRYYLYVRNSGAGDPLSSTPTGYTSYGSIGQYFISGQVVASSGFVIPPVAELLPPSGITLPGQGACTFNISYSDNVAIDVTTLDGNDIRVTGPNGYDHAARLISVDNLANGTPRVATYAADPPQGPAWLPADEGAYTLWIQTNQVRDTEGAAVAPARLGTFTVSVPAVIYSANMDTDPGWTLEPQWEYGTPAYTSGGPTGGFTGTKIIAYNLSGNYADNLTTKYATTPVINCSGSSSASLHFKRWLRTGSRDPVSIQVSTDQTTWTDVWASSSGVSDTSWQDVQYTLPPGVAGSPAVRLRWTLASSQSRNDIGWNIDDVEVLVGGAVDTSPPVASLSIGNITSGGAFSHSCSVTYTDNTAVRLASLGQDLVVTGPNGYSNLVGFVGADLPADGSPITATYSIPAPGGSWDAADNGTYSVRLLDNEVADIYNNFAPGAVLGTFTVSISAPGVLAVSPAGAWNASGTAGGPFTPSSMVYTLTNSGGSTLNWSASKAQAWVNLSAASGSLAAGQSASLTASLNAGATALPPGTYNDLIAFTNTLTGQGGLSRAVSLLVQPVPTVQLTVSANFTAWGSVSPGTGAYPAGSAVQLLATPALYYQFDHWSGDLSGATNPLSLVLQTNTVVGAVFAEVLTVNHPTPLWWLASQGYAGDFESAVTQPGANGMPLWQSYIAGLNPNDPQSRLLLSGQPAPGGAGFVLSWSTVSNRVYSLWFTPDWAGVFAPVSGATNLPWTIRSFTNTDNSSLQRFYRLEVQMP